MKLPANLQHFLPPCSDPAVLLDQIRQSPPAQIILKHLRAAVPGLGDSAADIPQTTYTLYRQFALNGDRAAYEERYFAKRAMLNRAVVEMILGSAGMTDTRAGYKLHRSMIS
jgi:hypothetical protein